MNSSGQDNQARNATDTAIVIGNTNAIVRRNTVTTSGESGERAAIELDGAGSVAEGNTVLRCVGSGIRASADGITIRDCVVQGGTYAGIVVGRVANVTVLRCTVSGFPVGGIVNGGTSTVLRDSRFSGARRDVSITDPITSVFTEFTGVVFRTGGPAVTLFDAP